MNIFHTSTLLRFLSASTLAVAAVVMPTVAFGALDNDAEGAPATGARTLKKTERVRDFNADPAQSGALQNALNKAKDQARAHYNEGQALFKTAEQSERRVDYEAAAAKFHEAYLYDSDPGLLQWEALSWLRAQKYENAERAFRKVLSNPRAMNVTKQDAIGYLAQIEQQKADSGQKADEKIAYAINLGLDAPSVEVGKLLVDAFANDPKSEYAYFAAKAYANAGDKTRAAGMYREALSTSASEVSAYKKVAERWLEANGLTVEPKYSHLKAVRSNYTETQHPSTEYLEEFKPQHDVWGGQIRPAIQNFLGLGTFEGRDVTGDRERFKYRTVRPLGAGVNQNDLLIQGVSYVLSKANWSEDKKKEVLAKVGLSSKDLVSNWPIVDAIKSASVTYLKTDAERAPYRLSMTNDGILMRNGSVFDTKELSTMFSGPGWAIYVMSPDGELYSGAHRVSAFHHSSFLAGSPVAGAGEIKVVDGKIEAISNKSGHYQPAVVQLVQTLDEIASRLPPDQLPELERIAVYVGGQTSAGQFKTKPWPRPDGSGDQGSAADFLAQYNDVDRERKAFFQVWRTELNFVNDPFAGE